VKPETGVRGVLVARGISTPRPRSLEMTENESLVFGTGFGVVTDIETGPNGNLFVVSLDQGAIYEISRR
jgi:hypothetical protein